MKPAALIFALAPLLAAAQAAPVQVAFGDLEKFTDLRNSFFPTERERRHLADELARHIERRAAPRLPPGKRLAVTLLDVDMAGDYPNPARELRVVKEIYPPRIDLEFRLLNADGSVERSGRRELRDLGFLRRAIPAGATEVLRHEKGLIDGWLARELAPAR